MVSAQCVRNCAAFVSILFPFCIEAIDHDGRHALDARTGPRPATTETTGRARLLPLDLMRGTAAMLVVIYHASPYSGLFYIGINATHCVDFFFILSGYALAYAYGDAITGSGMGLRDLVAIRLARLYPLHLVTFGVTAMLLAAVAAGRWYAAQRGLVFPIPVAISCTPTDALETLTLTHTLLGGVICFDKPSWSISVEFWSSLSLLVLFAPRLPSSVRAGLILIGAAGFVICEIHGGFLNPDASLLPKYTYGFGCFLLGWALHATSGRWQPLVARIPGAVVVGSGIALVLFVVLSPLDSTGRTPFVDLFYVVPFCWIIAISAHRRVTAASRVMALAGDWSYGIYLWHFPLLFLLSGISKAAGRLLDLGFSGTPVFDGVFYPLLMVTCAASFRYIEIPSKRAVRHALSRSVAAYG